MKVKRKARKLPKEHKNMDVMKPLTIENIGSQDDPCYGKHYSLKAEECKRCGAAELCAVISTQRMHKEIKAASKKMKFKDVEETELIISQNKIIGTYLRSRAEKKPNVWLSFKKIVPKLLVKFNLTEVEEENMRQRCINAVKEDGGLKLHPKLTKFKL